MGLCSLQASSQPPHKVWFRLTPATTPATLAVPNYSKITACNTLQKHQWQDLFLVQPPTPLDVGEWTGGQQSQQIYDRAWDLNRRLHLTLHEAYHTGYRSIEWSTVLIGTDQLLDYSRSGHTLMCSIIVQLSTCIRVQCSQWIVDKIEVSKISNI